MKIHLHLAALLILISTVSNAQFLPERSKQEHALNAAYDMSIDEMKSFGFSSRELPSSASLQKYAIVSDQKDASSCTGFAIAGALNILYNQLNDITLYSQKLVHKFDPNFIYSSLKNPNDLACISGSGCNCGSFISDATKIVTKYGIKKLSLSPGISCSVTLNDNLLSQMSFMTKYYRLDGWGNVVKWEEKSGDWYWSFLYDDLKFVLASGLPLVTGIYTSREFVDSRNNFIPPKGPEGPHAVVIVGYDDYYNGGSFKVLNSYGTDFGENGYFWIKYTDLADVFMSSGIYFPWNDEGDFSSWFNPVSTADFYRGKTTSGVSWEGLMKNNYLQGTGIYVDDDWSMIASFEEGILNGWCVYLGNKKDDFWGLLKFENGEAVDSKSFGFASEEDELFINAVTKNLDNQTDNLSDDIIEKIENVYKINVE